MSIHTWTEKQTVVCMYHIAKWRTAQQFQEQVFDTHNMDELQNNYPKWEKPDRANMHVWFHICKILGSVKQCIVTEKRSAVAWRQGKDMGGKDYKEAWQNFWEWQAYPLS